MLRSRTVACSCVVFFYGHAQASISTADYDAEISATSNGQRAAAIERLRQWQREDPTNRHVVFDLASLLDQSTDYQAALKYVDKIARSGAPLYALKAVAHSARLTEDWKKAASLYQEIRTRFPGDAEAQAGQAYVYLGLNQTEAALDLVNTQLSVAEKPLTQRVLPLLVARAEIREKRREWIDAASAYQEALLVDPNFRYALRGKVFNLQKAGFGRLAHQEAALHPEIFDRDERLALARTADAYAIRYGEIQLETDDTAKRFAATDRALNENRAIVQEFGAENGTQFDLLVALRDRRQMREAIILYESLRASGVRVPSYASVAAADAYLFLKQPETARDLYLNALNNPDGADSESTLEWKISLMYAYSEAEQHQLAKQFADKTGDAMPLALFKGIRGLETPNADLTRVNTVSALLDLSNERLQTAQTKLSDMREQAPFDKDIRLAWAALQSAREHPRAALKEYRGVAIDYPDALDAPLGESEMSLTLNEFATAKSVFLEQLVKQPQNAGVLNLAKQLTLYDQPIYRIDGRFGKGQTSAGEESVIDASLYSAPLTNSMGDRYRVFTHAMQINGKTQQESAYRTRIGAGFDYRSADAEVEVEANQSSDHRKSLGLGLKTVLNFSDNWHISFAADSNIADLPAAALRDRLTGELLKFGLNWTLNESRQANLELSTLHFSDGNNRQSMLLGWRERLLSEAAFKLDTGLNFSTSSNSLPNRVYFNPTRDREVDAEAIAEWTTWRRYQRSFRQRFAVTAGSYCQSRFNCGTTADLRYEHEWNFDDRLGLRYGIGRVAHPYDGNREFQTYFYFSLTGHF